MTSIPVITGGGVVVVTGAGTPALIGSVAPSVINMPAQALLLYGGNPQDAMTNIATLAGLPFNEVAPNYNILLLNPYLGLETTEGVTWPTLISGWKASASANGLSLKCFFYTNGMGPVYLSSATTYTWHAQALSAANMWAYTSLAGSGTTDLLTYAGSATTNAWYQVTPYNIQTMPASTINGKTNVLLGANIWTLDVTYWTDVLINGLATSKYGEANSNVANAQLDGIFFDNVSPNLRGISGTSGNHNANPASWVGFGGPLEGWNATSDAAVQLGQANLVTALNTVNSRLLNIGNGAGGVQGTASTPNPGGDDNEIYNSPGWDFFMAQYVFGVSFSMESFNNSPPGAFMGYLSYAMNCVANGGTLIVEAGGFPGGVAGGVATAQSSWTAAHWSGLRMMVCSAIMGGYYFAIDEVNASNPGNSLLWDDMYQAAGANSIAYNWLGAAIDPPQTTYWATFANSLSVNVNVWRRRFANGTVFWIPRQAQGSGNLDTANTVTVTGAGTGLSYCANTTLPNATMAYSDTAVNTGAAISSANGGTVTLINDGYGAGLVLRATPT